MAGCISEKPKLYEDSENYQTRKLEASGIPQERARPMAHATISHRQSVNEKFTEQDKLGIEGEGPEFSLTAGGDVYFLEYGGYLNELYQTLKDVYPDQYNPEEHATVLSAYQFLLEGGKQAAHVVHHYDAQGQLDIRDIVVLTYNSELNIGVMHTLNISQAGKNHHTLESAREAMQQRLLGFQETRQAANTFLFVRKEAPIDPITLFKEKPNIVQGHESRILVQNDRPKTQVEGGTRAIRETFPLVRPVMKADEKHPGVPFKLPFFLQRLMGRDENGNIRLPDHNVKKDAGKSKTAELTRNIKRQEIIQSNHTQMREHITKIAFVQATSVGIGGAFVHLRSIIAAEQKFTKKERREFAKNRKKTKRKLEEQKFTKKERRELKTG